MKQFLYTAHPDQTPKECLNVYGGYTRLDSGKLLVITDTSKAKANKLKDVLAPLNNQLLIGYGFSSVGNPLGLTHQMALDTIHREASERGINYTTMKQAHGGWINRGDAVEEPCLVIGVGCEFVTGQLGQLVGSALLQQEIVTIRKGTGEASFLKV